MTSISTRSPHQGPEIGVRPINLLPYDGKLYLIRDVVEAPDKLMERLLRELDWQQDEARILGRRVKLPRLTAWYGDAGYRYSGIDNVPRPWIPLLLELKDVAEAVAETPFNSVLANLYRNGRDSMGWHSDDERSLGKEPVIASLSFGATRRFRLKHKTNPEASIGLDLPAGSCLVMAGVLQHRWRHALPKTARPVGSRINLTFRTVKA